nr:MAG TPA: minor tail protein [Caudoviricetes sp.]
MASRIQGITIEIGGDTTKLDKALKDTDTQLSKVQKNLRDVERLLKLDPTNTELLAQKQRLLAEQSSIAAERVAKLEDAAGKLDSTLEKSKLDDFNLELDLTRARASNAEEELKNFERALDDVDSTADGASGSLDDVTDASDGMQSGFSLADGVISNFAGGVMTKLLDVAIQAAEAIWNLDEATEEYRESMALLNTAFESAGFGPDTARQAYEGFYEILGDTGQATEASQLLAQLAVNEQDVAEWIDIAAGVYGTFGESLPIESLIEAANETAKTATVTGTLADALNWVGLSEDEVNSQLALMGDETSRARYLMDLLSNSYQDSSDIFYENTESLRASRDAQMEMDDTMAELGQSVADLKTQLLEAFGPSLQDLVEAISAALEALSPIIQAIAGAISLVISAVSTLISLLSEAVSWLLELLGLGGSGGEIDVTTNGGSPRGLPEPDLQAYNYPAFAAGGVIPPNNPFLAVLGDNRQEPEIVSPYSTIKQAAMDAMAERGGAQTVTIIIRAADGFTRNLSYSLSQEAARQGVRLVNQGMGG